MIVYEQRAFCEVVVCAIVLFPNTAKMASQKRKRVSYDFIGCLLCEVGNESSDIYNEVDEASFMLNSEDLVPEISRVKAVVDVTWCLVF
jgi:hypothetical protein